jgi:hypothetical protein
LRRSFGLAGNAKHEAELPKPPKMISLVRLIRDLDKEIYG